MTGLERLTMIRIAPTMVALVAVMASLSAGGCSSSSGGGGRLIPAVDGNAADEGGDAAANAGAAGDEGEAGNPANAGDEGDATEPDGVGDGAGSLPQCELASTRAGCDACLSNFCQPTCAECAGTECDSGYSCVADDCSDPEEETDLDCVVDCSSDDDSSARALYALIDCGKLNCPGYCHF